MRRAIKEAFRSGGQECEGRVFTEDEFIDAVEALVDHEDAVEIGVESDNQMFIDAMGRIYVDGFHVGWVKRDAGLIELKALAVRLGSHLPSLDAMLKVREMA